MSLSSDIRGFCSSHGLKLNTDLGQHFLIDGAVLQKIVRAGAIEPSDHILEIGPGIGVLTKELLKHAEKVTSIELDQRFIELVQEYTGNSEKLTVIQGNALDVDFPNEPYKIIANIPYHITSPLLRHAFLESEVTPQSMTLLIQHEVAEKICDTKDHGILTILVGLLGKPKMISKVPPKAFLPPPKVDSAILHIDCFDKPIADRETIEEIFVLTKAAFSQKRKMLRNTIDPERLKRAGIDEERRPQTLSIEEWVRLAGL